MEDIQKVQWWAVLDDVNFVLQLTDGRSVPLHLLSGAGAWNAKLHGLMGESLLAQTSLPNVEREEQVEK